VTIGLLLTACVFASVTFSQQLPSFQWAQEVDASGTDSVAGLGTDAQGNVYVAGSTLSRDFPVKGAVQGQSASSGLYRLNGTTWMALGLSSGKVIVADPQSPGTFYALSRGVLVKSTDGGVTFTPLVLPSSQPLSIAIQPGNAQVLFVPTFDQGVLTSADGGARWMPVKTTVCLCKGGSDRRLQSVDRPH
jgi:hypothetical protein